MIKIFLICPIREISEETKRKIVNYINRLEKQGNKLYYPARDTNQNDLIGYSIITENRNGLLSADEVHIWYNKNSIGSIFDLGMAWASNKTLVIANPDEVKETEGKSFENVILEWSKSI